MKRILVFVDNFDVGGVTSVISAIYRNIDRSEFKMDFARRNCNINDFDHEVIKNGDTVYYFNEPGMGRIPLLNYKQKQLNISKQICKQIDGVKYDVIHIHSRPVIGLHIAMKAHIPVRIMHTHEAVPDFNGDAEKSFITRLLYDNRMRVYRNVPTVKAGDSKKACIAKFGEDVVNDPRMEVIHPPVDMGKFDPSGYEKESIIRKFGIDASAFNMIHVGRLNPVKNQSFMIDVLAELNKSKNAELYIVGDGELKTELIEHAKKTGMADKVHFLPGNTTPGIYTAMDCSLLPSFSEAFGMVAVESQVMGVPCFASVNVPEDVDIGMCSFLELDAIKWADAIAGYDFANAKADSKKRDMFSIKSIVDKVSAIYSA